MPIDRELEGLLLVDKPEGPTSHDIVNLVRRLTGVRRVGHAGTLDPLASGLLPMVLGRATRLVRFLSSSPKVYEGRLRLGLSTISDDITGELLSRHSGSLPEAETVLRAAARLTGRILQVPPAVSARKLKGQRLYRLARQGRPVEAPPAEVEVRRFTLRAASQPAEWSFVAEVSTGTYIRALARDLGEALGTGGVLVTLRRRAIGPMTIDDAVALPAVGEPAPDLGSRLIPLESMPLEPPLVELADRAASRRFLSGAAVAVEDPGVAEGWCRVLDGRGSLLGIGEVSGETLRPKVVLPAPSPVAAGS